MREEMIKFDRYQKQFKFLFSHNIETGEDLQKYQKDKEAEVEMLITRRKKLYDERKIPGIYPVSRFANKLC